ncbi:MAG: hypothetical protein EOP84_08625 [Verrucomicrobiaceae bacterium]|nr:MAG: hypothetical protein EOP84_08625 [Verrucomicrobiaceae bacterium]
MALLMAAGPLTQAQDLKVQPTPFSVWLDFEKLSAPNPPKLSLPIWLESVLSHPLPAQDGAPEQTAFRIRLRRMAHLNSEIQLRIFYQDLEGRAPVVSGWSETGALRYQSAPLGAALDLPSSVTLTISVGEIDYLEVTVPGDGTNVRGVFLATLTKTEGRTPLDFAELGNGSDPFGNTPLPPTPKDDLYLYGRIRATLCAETVKLEPATGMDGMLWDLHLDVPPLAALITFEILSADVTLPPEITVNDRPLGAVNLLLPDLADPGYRGDVRPLEREMRFRYTGWIRCQKLIPASALVSGVNQLQLRLNRASAPVAVRAVEIQLKHHWKDFDYTVTPK